MKLSDPGVYPLPRHEDGRKASISDGYHSSADVAAGKAVREHRGQDLMYWKPRERRGRAAHPWESKGYEIPRSIRWPALSAWPGRIVAAGVLRTGGWVALDHGGGVGTAYHHLSGLLVGKHRLQGTSGTLIASTAVNEGPCDFAVGDEIPAGYPIGFVGGSPIGFGLVHLHFDVATSLQARRTTHALGRLSGRFVDAAKYMKSWRHVSLAEAWGDIGRVEPVG